MTYIELFIFMTIFKCHVLILYQELKQISKINPELKYFIDGLHSTFLL